MGRRRKDPHPLHVTVIRYEQPDGTRCAKSTPGAVKKVTQSETYYAWVTTAEGRTRIPLGTANEAEAWAVLNRKLKELHDEALGIRDRFTEHAERSLVEHVDDWLKTVEARGTEPSRVQTMRSRLTRLAALAGWTLLPHLSASSALKALAALQQEPATNQRGRGRSAQTRNHYLSHLKQFARWCDDEGRLKHDPVRGLKPVSVETDRRHDRRSPADDEVSRLFAHLAGPDAVTRRGLTGPARALAYRICMATGYRAGELRSLTRESFDLAAGTLTVLAGYSKRGREDCQHLPDWLVLELREWFAAGGGCWSSFPEVHPGKLLKADLTAAGVPYEVRGPNGPLYFDFHSLRHWYCTQVGNTPGISPKTVMTLTRHSTLHLALKVYAKAQTAAVKEAVAKLPEPGKRPAAGKPTRRRKGADPAPD